MRRVSWASTNRSSISRGSFTGGDACRGDLWNTMRDRHLGVERLHEIATPMASPSRSSSVAR